MKRRDGWWSILSAKSAPPQQDIACRRIRELAERGLNFPAMIDVSEVQELCGAIVHHHSNLPNPLFSSDTLFLPNKEG